MMRQGRGRGKGHGKGRRKRMLGFLQPCILVQLTEEDRHGYDLYLGLGDFIEDAETLDPSMVYRQMREMERSGYVRSYEGDISLGPKRKMYSLTPDGMRVLKLWAQDMKRTKREIDTFLTYYAQNSSVAASNVRKG